jgi:antitoxin VapB
MSDTGIAKIFMHGRSQAVRLPLAFRLPGDRVRVRRVASGILLLADGDRYRRLVRSARSLC